MKKSSLHSLITVTASLFGVLVAVTANPLSLGPNGTQRELFIDGHMIEKMTGDVRQQLQLPEPKEVVLTTDAPWEGNTCAYYTIFRDGDLFRMYYRGSHWDTATKTVSYTHLTLPTNREV